MQPADYKDVQPRGGTFTALHSLLGAVAHTVKAREVCLVSPTVGDNCITLVSSGELQHMSMQPYISESSDRSVPVLYGERELAQLVVKNAPSGIEDHTLEAFARAAGYILGHAEELSEAASALEESRVLHELGLQFGESKELQGLLDSVVRGIRRVLNVDYANLATVEPNGDTRWLAVDGYKTDEYARYKFTRGKGTAARVIATHKPVVMEGIGRSPELPAEDFPVHTAEGGVSVLSVPLMVKGSVIGALTLAQRTDRTWKPNEIQLATVVANGAAMAISQARASTSEREQRTFLEKVIENYPGVLVVLSSPPDWRVVLANPGFAALLPEPFRSSGQSLVGLRAAEFSNPEPTEQNTNTIRLLTHVLETGESVAFEQFASDNAAHGTTYWNWIALPIDSMDETTGKAERLVMLIAHDVTDTVKSRKAAQESAWLAQAKAAELDAVISHMADGMAVFDADGRVVTLNPAGEQLIGRSLMADVDPQDYPERYGFFTAAGDPYSRDQLPSARALKGETVVSENMVVRKPRSDESIIRVSSAPLTDASGTVTGAVSVFHDITQDKLVERLKDEFLSIVSHELRTPLTAIIGYSDLMLRGVHGGLADKQAKVLNSVRANADRLLRLINDLLDVSKLESGSVHLITQPTDLSEVVTKIVTQTRVLAVNAGVTINNMLPERRLNLADVDESKLQQIVENLITNAIKYAPGAIVTVDGYLSPLEPGDPALTETPPGDQSEVAAHSMVVQVSDTGSGLEADQLARIWDRFYQVDTSVKRRSGGAGLGLTIVRSLVELHGGLVWAQSEGVSRGSTFSFSLPIVQGRYANTSPVPEPSPQARAAARAYDQRPVIGTILVAEDDADQREIICEMLEMEGFEVVLASTGEEAIDLAVKVQPSAIALDVILPRRDGWEVLQHLRSNPATRDIPVLIISVVDQAEFGKKLGADEYLLKPLDPKALRTTIRKLVLLRNQRKQQLPETPVS